jgi:hypothetical protein
VLKARELGWVNGQNMLVEKRWAEGQIDRLPQLAADLINSKVDVILALGGFAAVAAKRATRTIPVVFSAPFPVERGIVNSLAHPGGNLTGIAINIPRAKTLDFLHELVPGTTRVAYVADPELFVPPHLTLYAFLVCGRLCHSDGGPEGGASRRRVLMLAILPISSSRLSTSSDFAPP